MRVLLDTFGLANDALILAKDRDLAMIIESNLLRVRAMPIL